jgi:hypothetical protein
VKHPQYFFRTIFFIIQIILLLPDAYFRFSELYYPYENSDYVILVLISYVINWLMIYFIIKNLFSKLKTVFSIPLIFFLGLQILQGYFILFEFFNPQKS